MRHRDKTSSRDSTEKNNTSTTGEESISTGKNRLSERSDSDDKIGRKRRKRAILWSWIWKCSLLISVLFYLAFPLVTLLMPDFASQLIFLNYVRCPVFREFQSPAKYGLKGARNFYLPSTGHVQLGVWQILPKSVQVPKEKDASEEFYEKILSDGKPIVMYCHGNSGSRLNPHRREVYKVLSSLDYHVIAVDYRGYGDSSNHTTPDGIHEDVATMYRWVKERKGDSPLYIWGHSLGTGISTVFTAKTCNEEGCPTGLILEAPFNNLLEEVSRHPLGMPWNMLPGSRPFFKLAFNYTAPYFQSDTNIKSVTCPILFLHAEDDYIVPFDLGKKLYDVAVETRPPSASPVKFVSFGSEGYGHKNIAYSPKLPPLLREFIK